MTTKRTNLILLAFLIALAFCQTSEQQIVTEQQGTDIHTDETHTEQEQAILITISQRWGFGFLAGLGVSLLGFGTAIVIVCCKHMASDGCFEMTIKFLFSLAFGALLGDAMIHLLPAGYSAEGADSRITAGIFIGSILFFLILERIFEACGITHKHWHNDDCHDDHQGAIQNHHHSRKVHNEDKNHSENLDITVKVQSLKSSSVVFDDNNVQCSHNHNHCKPQQHEHHNHVNDNTPTKCQIEEEKSCLQNLKGKGSAGYMNLLGSLIHNFMDGLALGVAFATGDPKVFVPILVAIIAHQIPRQMGDVAILMTNSFSSTQTILCNGIVNLTSLIGLFIGLAITDLDELTKNYILVFVAGNFIFIAADIWRNLFKNSGFLKNFIQFIGFGVGVAAMYLILLLESDEEGHQH